MTSNTPTTGHPKGLYLLFFTEMWERFSYYGMRAIFTLYMINALLFDKAFASKIYGSYTGLVYLTPLLGGYIADRYWGNRRSIIFGGVLMAIGQFLMFMSGSVYDSVESSKMFMYSGLGFLIFGNGFFKPNISTMVGQLYPEGDRRIDSAFTIFYQGINLGALLAPVVCGSLGEQYNEDGSVIPHMFKWGFLAACFGMIISLITFIWLKNKYIVTPDGNSVGLPPKQAYNRQEEVESASAGGFGPTKIAAAVVGFIGLFSLFFYVLEFDLIGSLIFSSCLVLPALIITEPSLTPVEKQRIWVIYIIAFFVIFFWSAFEQAGASLTFFAQEQTDRNVFGWNMPASLFQSFNAFFIVVLAPVAVAIWGTLAKRNMEPPSPVKQAMGLGFLALGYLFIAWGVNGVQPWEKVSMMWLIGLYFIHTIGELCLSPIGLSMVVKLAPARFVSLLMGVWFMSTATANKFAGDLSALYPEDVKLEYVAEGNAAVYETLKRFEIQDTVFKMSAKDFSKIQVAQFSVEEVKDKDGKKKVLNSIQLTGDSVDISNYPIKLIKTTNGKFKTAIVNADGTRLLSYKRDEQKTQDGLKVEEKVEVWNLKPEKPKFLGSKVENLYDFFMLFVYMAGAAAIILYLIHKPLLKMMHGKR